MATIDTVHCKMYSAGALYSDWMAPSTNDTFIAGYSHASKNHIGVIRFVLSKPAGSITFNFTNTTGARTVNQFLRFKFTTNEDEALVQSIEDGFTSRNNIAGDTIKTLSEWGTNASSGSKEYDGKFEIYKNSTSGAKTAVTFYKSFPAGTHYIYIWSDDFGTINSPVQSNVMTVGWQNTSGAFPFSATYEEAFVSGVVYIDNGTSFDAYEIWIDNGAKWERYVAYIDNGSSWDECG